MFSSGVRTATTEEQRSYLFSRFLPVLNSVRIGKIAIRQQRCSDPPHGVLPCHFELMRFDASHVKWFTATVKTKVMFVPTYISS